MEAMEIMGMDQQGLEELAAQLAKELLARKGYDVIDGDWMLGRRGLVARDGDCLVFADVAPDLGVDCGFEPIDIDRSAAEGAAFAYLSDSYGGRRRRDSVRRRQGQAPPQRQGVRQARRERPRRGRLARLGPPRRALWPRLPAALVREHRVRVRDRVEHGVAVPHVLLANADLALPLVKVGVVVGELVAYVVHTPAV